MARMLTPKEAADRLTVSTETIYRWLDAKKLNGVHIGRTWRIPESELALLGANLDSSAGPQGMHPKELEKARQRVAALLKARCIREDHGRRVWHDMELLADGDLAAQTYGILGELVKGKVRDSGGGKTWIVLADPVGAAYIGMALHAVLGWPCLTVAKTPLGRGLVPTPRLADLENGFQCVFVDSIVLDGRDTVESYGGLLDLLFEEHGKLIDINPICVATVLFNSRESPEVEIGAHPRAKIQRADSIKVSVPIVPIISANEIYRGSKRKNDVLALSYRRLIVS